VLLSLALSLSFLAPCAVLAEGVDTGLKQAMPEPLDKEDGSGIAGGASTNGDGHTSVLPPLPKDSYADDGDNQLKEFNNSSGQATASSRDASSGAALKLPSSDSDSDTESGYPSTASIAAKGPLKLSLPTSEFILPADGVLSSKRLHGTVTETPDISPLLSGSVQTIPDGVKVDLTLQGNLNSEISQKGSEVFAEISRDVTDSAGNKVYLPGGWVAHGYVTARSGQSRHSHAGWAEVTFDKIISPDGKYDVPFEAKLSTKDNTVVSAAKVIATDAKYMSIGAAAGSVLSVQLTGIPLAVASHGYSVAIGAAIGAGIGLFGAVRKKGPILSLYRGEQLKLTTSGSIQMPGFNLANLPSAKKPERVVGLYMQVNKAEMLHDTFLEDKKARVLVVNFVIENHTKREFLLNNLCVKSELQQVFLPHINSIGVKHAPLTPGSSQTLRIPFSVDAGKHQYSLVLCDASGKEVRREPIKLD